MSATKAARSRVALVLLALLAACAAPTDLAKQARGGDDAALERLRTAAEAGNAESQYQLAGVYASGSPSLAPDAAEQARWLEKAAAQGYAPAELDLGHAYASGSGVARDADKAMLWWTRAAQAGVVEAQLRLGLAFTEGVLVPRDEAKAFFWMHEAATRGNEEAMTYLARMYANGVGTARDPSEALRWLKAPLARKDARARAIYGEVCWTWPGACEIRESERRRIVGVVLLTFAMTEKCRQEQPVLRGELERAFAAWRSRNFRYVEFALTDPSFGGERTRLLESAERKRLSEAQCRETVANLDERKVDIDYLRAQPRPDERPKELQP